MALFTTSWDDGSIYDIKLADVLEKYNIKGTFYIPCKVEWLRTLSRNQIREIGKKFEVGGHTYSHIILTSVKDEIARKEIEDNKKAIEDIIGKQIASFSPPQGKFSKRHLKIAEDCGFLLFRTCGYLRVRDVIKNINNMKIKKMFTTLQVYPHTLPTRMISAAKRIDLEAVALIAGNLYSILNWRRFGQALLTFSTREGNENCIFHLWGHSWELEKYNLWTDLESLLKYVKETEKFYFATNSEIIEDDCR